MSRRASALTFLVVSLASGQVATEDLRAQIPEGMEGSFQPHPEGRDAISRLYSPFCPGFMLEVCTSSQAVALRDSIHGMAYMGSTSDEIVEWMLGNHGQQYLAVPGNRGTALWAWVLPPGALIAGAGLVLWALARFNPTRPRETVAEKVSGQQSRTPHDPSREEEERLRAAIREIELSEDPSF